MEEEKVRGIIKLMRLADKAALTGGGLTLASPSRPKLGDVELGDFLLPHAVSEPLQIALGCTFSPSICSEVAKAQAARSYARQNLFAGAVRAGLIRDPYSPDAAEFFSEDAFVTAELLKGYVPIDGFGFVFTDSLGQGRFVSRTIDNRALRELYLYPLMKAGMSASAIQLDGGYLNGARICNTEDLCALYSKYVSQDALVLTQYGDIPDIEGLFESSMYVLGATEEFKRGVRNDVVRGEISEQKVERAIERTLGKMLYAYDMYGDDKMPQGLASAAMPELTRAASVLLKNDGTLPAVGKKLTVFCDASQFADGALFDVHPIKDAARLHGKLNVFLITDYENDGIDHNTIGAIIGTATVAPTVVMLCGGCAADITPFNNVNAIMFCPHRPTIAETVNMLVNPDCSPQGRLPFTWCASPAAYPVNNKKYKPRGDFRYESLYNGYLLFNNYESDVLYPFGHGLDYTSYEITKFKLYSSGSKITAEFIIKNTGKYAGDALCQAYISLPSSPVYGISKRLAAFKRVALDRTENANVVMEIDINDFAAYDEVYDNFITPGGKYSVDIGLSSTDIRAHGEIKVAAASRIEAGLSERTAPTYYAVGKGKKFEPTAPEIEKLLKVPFIKKPDEHRELAPPPEGTVKKALRRAEKWTPKRVLPIVRYRLLNTPVINQPK